MLKLKNGKSIMSMSMESILDGDKKKKKAKQALIIIQATTKNSTVPQIPYSH